MARGQAGKGSLPETPRNPARIKVTFFEIKQERIRGGEEQGKSFSFPVQPRNPLGSTKMCFKVTPAVIKDDRIVAHMF